MKSLILFVALFCTINLSAQEIEIVQSKTAGFDVESGTAAGTITVDGVGFDVFETTKGSKYVKAPSSKGGFYPMWIGEESTFTTGGKPLRVTGKGTLVLLSVVDGKLKRKYVKKK